MLNYKAAACVLAAVALAAVPTGSASAHYYRHGGGIFWGIGALGAAVVGTAAAIATAPFVALAPRPYYGAPPAYYAPPPAYYPPPQAYYAPPPAYYAPPGYYAQPGYYGPR
jgi:hypothetical protein